MSCVNGIRLNVSTVVITSVAIVYFILITNACFAAGVPSSSSSSSEVKQDVCKYTLMRPSGFIGRHLDVKFWKKFFTHLNPFTSRKRVKMQFILFKKDFRDCGRVIDPENEETLESSGFKAYDQTRIIIHGWMSQARGSWHRATKNAYLDLASKDFNVTDGIESNNITDTVDNDTSTIIGNNATDYNVIVVDWSVVSTNVNYFKVVDLIDDLGFLLAEFVRFLNMRSGLNYDDVYLIGHSLGAHIAGSAGKQSKPFIFNTIFALDPAGPQFHNTSSEYRLDPSDAKYVESIQTSSSFGLEEPTGHATFYPNFGHSQKKCHKFGCSHSRSHDYFAESITSKKGFWGKLCKRESGNNWVLSQSGAEFRMGGEPSSPKSGTFLVKTNDRPPYAMGRSGTSILREHQSEIH